MTQTNSDNESISAILDGECSNDEIGRLLKRLGKDGEARSRLDRYSLIGDAMRGELAPELAGGFADRVRVAIEREPTLLAPMAVATSQQRTQRAWIRPAAGFAIAASVAMVSFVGLDQLRDEPQRPSVAAIAKAPAVATIQNGPATPRPGLMQTSTPATFAAVQPSVRESAVTRDAGQRELQERLNGYLLDHTEFARVGDMKGMLSYSRLVGYDRSQ